MPRGRSVASITSRARMRSRTRAPTGAAEPRHRHLAGGRGEQRQPEALVVADDRQLEHRAGLGAVRPAATGRAGA